MAAQAKPSVLCDSVPTTALAAGSAAFASTDAERVCAATGSEDAFAASGAAPQAGVRARHGLSAGMAPQKSAVIGNSPGVAAGLPLGIYVHVPFCSSTCDFCAFYQEKPRRDQIDLYLKAVAAELRAVRREILLGLPWVWQGEGSIWQGEDGSPREKAAGNDGLRQMRADMMPGGTAAGASSCGQSDAGVVAAGRAALGAVRQGANAPRGAAPQQISAASVPAVPFPAGFTVFFGGGTPGLLAAKDLEQLCTLVREALGDLGPILEWSIELAPSTVKADKVQVLLEQGVTRFSLGVQSFSERLLDALGRQHNPKQIFAAYETLRAGGAGNVNCDLMFALPGQSREDWLADLEQMRTLDPEHISTYCLTFEEDTALWVKLSQGRCKLDPENEAALYRETWRWLDAAGYRQYEVSNFAKEGFRSRHNLATWQMSRWRGIGPSAASQWGGYRFQNVANLGEWARVVLEREGLLLPSVAGYTASPAGGCDGAESVAGSRDGGESINHSHGSGRSEATGKLVAGGKTVGDGDSSGKAVDEAAASGGVLHIGKKPPVASGGAVWPPAGSEQHVALDNSLLAADALIFGLRRRDGVNREQWQQRFGFGRVQGSVPCSIADLSGSGQSFKETAFAQLEALFARLTKEGLLDDSCTESWRLTDEGLLVADAVGGEVLACFDDEAE